MSTEFKLPYTASEINQKLGKIDSLVATINGNAPDSNGNVVIGTCLTTIVTSTSGGSYIADRLFDELYNYHVQTNETIHAKYNISENINVVAPLIYCSQQQLVFANYFLNGDSQLNVVIIITNSNTCEVIVEETESPITTATLATALTQAENKQTVVDIILEALPVAEGVSY